MQGNKTNTFSWKHLAYIGGLFFALIAVDDLGYANPTGGSVVSGAATITTNPNDSKHLQINQSTNKAIINWQDFSIGADEHTQFIQPNSNAVILNRVLGGQESQILGRMSANGQIMLVNPAGIFFGPGSRIDAAGLVATTADIANEDFLAGRYIFKQNPAYSGTVINHGTITVKDTGLAALMAPGVENHGVINARLGNVALMAGDKYTIDLFGDGLLNFKVEGKTQAPRDGAIVHTGEIYADGGNVLMTANAAKEVVKSAINVSGVVQANAVYQKGGTIVLRSGGSAPIKVANARIIARGEKPDTSGGHVELLANHLSVESTLIDVSGQLDGGFVETSGYETIRLNDVDVQAGGATGAAGLWYIDPADLYLDAPLLASILNTLETADVTTEATNDIIFTADATYEGDRDAYWTLNAGRHIDFQGHNVYATGEGGFSFIMNAAAGNIYVAPTDRIHTNGGRFVSNTPLGATYMEGLIDLTGTGGPQNTLSFGNLVLTSDTTHNDFGSITYNGTINSQGPAKYSLTAISASGPIVFNGDIGTSVALVNLTATLGGFSLSNIELNANNIITDADQTYNGFQVTANSSINLRSNGGKIVMDAIAFTPTTSGTADLTIRSFQAGSTFPALSFTNPWRTVTISNDNNNVTTLGPAGSVVNTTGNQNYNSPIAAGGPTGNSTFTSTDIGGSINFNSSISGNSAGTNTYTGTNVNFSSTPTNIGNLVINGTANLPSGFNLTTSGSQTYNGLVNLTDAIDLTAGNNINIANRLDMSAGDATFNAGGNVTLANVDGNGNDLTINTSGATTISTFSSNLSNLITNVGGTTSLPASVTVADKLTINDTLTLAANTDLNSTNNDEILVGGVTGNSFDLTVNTTGDTRLNGLSGLNNLTTNAGGTTFLSGLISVAGLPTFNDTVELQGNTTIESTGGSDIALAGITGNNFNIDLNTSGLTTLTSAAGLNTITTNAGGTTQIPTTFNVNNLFINDTLVLTGSTTVTSSSGGYISVADVTGGSFDLALNTSGTAAFTGTINDLNNLNTQFGGRVTLGAPDINANSVTLPANFIDLSADTVINANNIQLGHNGSNALNSVGGNHDLTLNTSGNGNTFLNFRIGDVTPLGSLTTNADGTTTFLSFNAAFTGDVTFNNPVNAGAQAFGPTITANNITFNSTYDSPANTRMTLTATDTINLVGAFGATDPLTDLTLNAPTINILATSLNALNNINNNGGAILQTDLIINAANFNNTGTINSDATPRNLTINASGNTALGTLGNTAALSSVTTDAAGTVSLGGNITTVNAQNYNDTASLTANTVLTSNAGSNLGFGNSLNASGFDLTMNTSGTSSLVNGVSNLNSLTTDAGGNTELTGTLTVASTIDINDTLNLLGATTLVSTGGGVIDFETLEAAGNDLTITTSGLTTLDGTLNNLNNLRTNGGGNTSVGVNITTAGSQNYDDQVIITGDTVFTSTGSRNIAFSGGIGGAFDLTVNTGGETVLNTVSTQSFTTDAAGTTGLYGGAITTTAAINLNDPITMHAGPNSMNAGTDINLNSTLDGNQGLTLAATNAINLNGVMGGTTPLDSVTINGAGTLFLNSNINVLNGATTINTPTVLVSDASITGMGTGSILVNSTIDGNRALSLTAGGSINLGNSIGGTTALDSLTTLGSGITYIAADITTQGNTMTFNTPVQLTNDITLTDTGTTGVIFNNTLDGNGIGTHDLIVNTTGGGLTAFNGATGSINPLGNITTDAPGTVTINNSVTTITSQTYNELLTSTTGTAALVTLDKTATGVINLPSGFSGTNFSVDTGVLNASNIVADNATFVGGVALNATNVTLGNFITAGGTSGSNFTGSIRGFTGPVAALFGSIIPGSTGPDYLFNGCQIGTASCIAGLLIANQQQTSNNLTVDSVIDEGTVEVTERQATNLTSGEQHPSAIFGSYIRIYPEDALHFEHQPHVPFMIMPDEREDWMIGTDFEAY